MSVPRFWFSLCVPTPPSRLEQHPGNYRTLTEWIKNMWLTHSTDERRPTLPEPSQPNSTTGDTTTTTTTTTTTCIEPIRAPTLTECRLGWTGTVDEEPHITVTDEGLDGGPSGKEATCISSSSETRVEGTPQTRSPSPRQHPHTPKTDVPDTLGSVQGDDDDPGPQTPTPNAGPSSFSSWACDSQLVRSIVSRQSLQGTLDELHDLHRELKRARGEGTPFATDADRRPPQTVHMLGLFRSFSDAVQATRSVDQGRDVLLAVSALFSLKVMREHVEEVDQLQQQCRIERLLSRQLLTYFFMQVHRWNESGPAVADRLWTLTSDGQELDRELGCVEEIARAILAHLEIHPLSRPRCLQLQPSAILPVSGSARSSVDLDSSQARGRTKESFCALFLQAIHVLLVSPFLPESMKNEDVVLEMRCVAVRCQVVQTFVNQTGSTAFALSDGWERVLANPMLVYATGSNGRRPRPERFARALAQSGGMRVLSSLSACVGECLLESEGDRDREGYVALASTVVDYHQKVVGYLEAGVDFVPVESAESECTAISVPSANLTGFWVYLRAVAEWMNPGDRAPSLGGLLHYFSTGCGDFVPRCKEDRDPATPLGSECPGTKMFLHAVRGTNKLTSKEGISFLLWWSTTGQGWKTRPFCEPVGFPTRPEDIATPLCRWRLEDGPCDNTGFTGWGNRTQSFSGKGAFCCSQSDRDLACQRIRTWYAPELQQEWLRWLQTDANEVLTPGRTPKRSWIEGWDFLQLTAGKMVPGLGKGATTFLAANLLSYAEITAPCSLDGVDRYLAKTRHASTQALACLGLPTSSADQRRCSFRLLHEHLRRRLSPEMLESVRFSPGFLVQALSGFHRFITLHQAKHGQKGDASEQRDGMQELFAVGRDLGEEPGKDLLRWDERDIMGVYGGIPTFLALPNELGPAKRAREPDSRDVTPDEPPRTGKRRKGATRRREGHQLMGSVGISHG